MSSTGKRALIAGVLGLLGLVAWTIRWLYQPAPPATFWPAPEFTLTAVTSQSVRKLSQRDLRGHPWVADFIFTRCGGPCPLMSRKMAELQRELSKTVYFVSFTVDPEYDTPSVLQRYARLFQADPERWFFLRGNPEQLRPLMVEGFRLGLQENPGAPAATRVTHSTTFVLVDGQGMIRGFYDSMDPAFRQKLKNDLDAL